MAQGNAFGHLLPGSSPASGRGGSPNIFTLPPDAQTVRDNARQDRNDTRVAGNDAERLAIEAARLKLAQQAAEFQRQQDVVKAQQEREQALQAERLRTASQKLSTDETLAAIGRARGLTSGWSTGLAGQILGHIGGTDARDLGGQINTIAAATTLGKLGDMKAQSPNGASGLGALSEREGALLRDSIAALDQGQSERQFRSGLDNVERHYRIAQAINAGLDPSDPAVQRQYGLKVTPDTPQQVASRALQRELRGYTAQTKNLPALARQIGLKKLNDDPRMKRLWGIVNSKPAAAQPQVIDFNDLP